ncbi:hypothetical protein [Bacillus wiedmannii]|uniref:hypothetical protein n=1 Tax=Bacillus wiedmannii TaxID=1890302 RepID=UPI00211D1E05|nr:hypothetical protein [Bacillus wiedmannii]
MLSLITFISGIGCLVTYNVHSIETAVATAVAADRNVVETLYLLLIGYILIAISIISLFAGKMKKS